MNPRSGIAGSTRDPNPGNPVPVRVSLRIEEDETVPIELVQVAVDPDTDVILVVCTNFEGSADGARAVVALLEQTVQALQRELATEATTPKRPRFNPQPRKQGGK